MKLGDTTTPPKGAGSALTDVQQFEVRSSNASPLPLAQHEYDALVSFSYNVRQPRVLPVHAGQKLNAQDYPGACADCCAGASSWERTARSPATRGYAAGWLHGEKPNNRQCIGDAS